MSQKPDIEGVINFLCEGLEPTPVPRLRRKETLSAEDITLRELRTSTERAANDGETSSTKSVAPTRTSLELGDERRAVKRELNWYQIFFIALNGTLAVGLYVQGGAMLRLAGPVALIISFILLCALAWGVMQCIAEMLCIWPIPGALHQYVEKFVDKEVGLAVGAAYWFTNSMGFAAVMSGAGGEVQYWTSHLSGTADRVVRGVVVFTLMPLLLIWLNSRGVRLYGWVEVAGGSLKLLFVATITFSVYLFLKVGKDPRTVGEKFHASHYDIDAASNYGFAFVMCLPIAAFAFNGIEITAATAVEASADTRSKTIPFAPLKGPATKIPLYVGLIYILAAIPVVLYMDPTSPNLPPQPWISNPPDVVITSKSDSVFVQAAEAAGIPHFASAITAFLLFTAFTSANTLLYVASRTLYGLADANKDSPIGWLGITTEKHQVPVRALFASSAFGLITYFSLIGSSAITNVFDVLSSTSSVACIIVWAFECLAFLRFYFCIKKHRARLNNETRLRPLLRRFPVGHLSVDVAGETSNYPWRSKGQPFTGIISLVCCALLLVVANSASLWGTFHYQAFLGSYLALLCFFGLILYLKYKAYNGFRGWKWGVDLAEYDDAFLVLELLNDIRMNSIPAHSEGAPAEEAGVAGVAG